MVPLSENEANRPAPALQLPDEQQALLEQSLALIYAANDGLWPQDTESWETVYAINGFLLRFVPDDLFPEPLRRNRVAYIPELYLTLPPARLQVAAAHEFHELALYYTLCFSDGTAPDHEQRHAIAHAGDAIARSETRLSEADADRIRTMARRVVPLDPKYQRPRTEIEHLPFMDDEPELKFR